MAPKAKPPAGKAKAAPPEKPAKTGPSEKQLAARGQAPAAQKPVTRAAAAAKSPVKTPVEEEPNDAQLATIAPSPPAASSASPAAKVAAPEPVGSPGLALAPVKGGILNIAYALEGDGAAAVLEGLVRLRRSGSLCDTAVVAAGGARIAVHKVVLAAGSATLDERLKLAQGADVNLGGVSHEAADILIRWLYGEISAAVFKPSTSQVNEEVLKLSSELGLPRLSELCASRLASDITCVNIVSRIRVCEEFGLPRLRAALVQALIADKQVLAAVSQDPATLAHPALMRELLAAVASRAFEVDEEDQPSKKRHRS